MVLHSLKDFKNSPQRQLSLCACVFTALIMLSSCNKSNQQMDQGGNSADSGHVIHQIVESKQEQNSYSQQSSSVRMQDRTETYCTSEQKSYAPVMLNLKHIEAKGLGYKHGYTNLELFAISPRSPAEWLPLLDLRGSVFDNGRLAANAAVGMRHVGSSVAGFYVGYDYRSTSKHNYNQVAAGFELLGSRWDFRLNGYLPVGEKASSMKGLDAEFGYHFSRVKNIDFYGAFGPYYFIGNHGGPAVGGSARLAAQVGDYVGLELSTSFDRVFHGIVQGQISFTLPLGGVQNRRCNQKGYSGRGYVIENRARQLIHRKEIIVDRHQ